MNLSPEDVDEILKILDGSGYDELHLDTGRLALTLRREAGGWTSQQLLTNRERVADGPRPDNAGGSDAPREHAVAGDSRRAGAPPEGLLAVLAPLPGVFYRAPKPGAPPFVDVGGRVEADTVVGLIETMKLMNAIPAGSKGSVEEIATRNGDVAAKGDVLMWLRPDVS